MCPARRGASRLACRVASTLVTSAFSSVTFGACNHSSGRATTGRAARTLAPSHVFSRRVAVAEPAHHQTARPGASRAPRSQRTAIAGMQSARARCQVHSAGQTGARMHAKAAASPSPHRRAPQASAGRPAAAASAAHVCSRRLRRVWNEAAERVQCAKVTKGAPHLRRRRRRRHSACAARQAQAARPEKGIMQVAKARAA